MAVGGTYVIVTKAMVGPTADGDDQACGIQLSDTLSHTPLNATRVLTPLLVVDHPGDDGREALVILNQDVELAL